MPVSFGGEGRSANRARRDVAPLGRKLGLAAAALAALGMMTACQPTRGGKIPYGVALAEPDAPPVLTLDEDYRIAPLDTLRVSVFQVPDLTGDFEVDLTGRMVMPLLGTIKAVDRTTRDIQAEITEKLAAKYMQSPDVSVGLKSSTRRNITVAGSVRQEGMFPVTGPMTLVQAIALARGTVETANPRRVAVFRTIEGKRMAAAFDLTDIRRGEATDPPIYSGDIIIVDGSATQQLQRQIISTLPLFRFAEPFY